MTKDDGDGVVRGSERGGCERTVRRGRGLIWSRFVGYRSSLRVSPVRSGCQTTVGAFQKSKKSKIKMRIKIRKRIRSTSRSRSRTNSRRGIPDRYLHRNPNHLPTLNPALNRTPRLGLHVMRVRFPASIRLPPTRPTHHRRAGRAAPADCGPASWPWSPKSNWRPTTAPDHIPASASLGLFPFPSSSISDCPWHWRSNWPRPG